MRAGRPRLGALTMRVLGGLTLATASAIGVPAPQSAAQPPPGFPNLDGFTSVPADGYATPSREGAPPRMSFSVTPTLACDFYGGAAPLPQPSQDIKCSGDVPGVDDVPIPGGGHTKPGDCVVGSVNFKGPGYELSRMSYSGCDGGPAPFPLDG